MRTMSALAFAAAFACDPKPSEPSVPSTPPPAEKACHRDAKICADGSSVGRQGPNCEFAACPEDKK